MTTCSKTSMEYPSRKRRLLADLTPSFSSQESFDSVHHLQRIPPIEKTPKSPRAPHPVQWSSSQPRHVLLACREERAPQYKNFPQTPYQAPKTCKVVQRISDTAWIEINVPCDAPSLQEASNVIKQFAISYTKPQNQTQTTSKQPQFPMISSLVKSPYSSPFGSNSSLVSNEETLDTLLCSICLGPTESSHRHYGAQSCLSCRAFFRRSVQIEIYPDFTCNSDQKCVITPENRSKCKLCRFEKCQEKGMKISAVLNEDQKRDRFRRHLALKRLKQMEMKKALRRFRKNNHGVQLFQR